MEKFYAPHTPEAVAYSHISENSYDWDVTHSTVDENLVAFAASYNSLDRYLSGRDLFIVPRTRAELENVLRRYSYDAIHNVISKSRSTLQPGGYSRVCHLAENSIKAVLNTGDNSAILLSLHRSPSNANNHERNDFSPHSAPSIRTK